MNSLQWGMGYHLATSKLKRKPKVFCSKCWHVYPADLDKCPKCGHPNEDKDKPWHWIE